MEFLPLHCCEISHRQTDRHNLKESVMMFAFLSTKSFVTVLYFMSIFLCKSYETKMDFIYTPQVIYSTRMYNVS